MIPDCNSLNPISFFMMYYHDTDQQTVIPRYNTMIKDENIIIRNAKATEYAGIGQLLVDVYSQLSGFPDKTEQPEYYKMLENVGELTKNPDTEIIIAVTEENAILGAVVSISDMQY
jgi:hypothetical protein